MNRILSLNRNLIALSIPLVLFLVIVLITARTSFANNDTVALAITIDLLITIPIIYFILIRKTTIPNTTVVPVLVLGLAIGTFFLPSVNQNYLNLFKTWAMPVIELAVLSYIIAKVYRTRKRFKSSKGSSADFFSALKQACGEILPQKLVPIFATEVAVIYYGLIKWKSRRLIDNEFSYHKKSGTPTLLWAFLFIILVETVVLHILVYEWNEVVAWVLTGISIYTAFQITGFVKSFANRPIAITSDHLALRYGILNEVDVDLSNISEIELSKKRIKPTDNIQNLSPLGELEKHNVILHLKKVSTIIGLYGMKKHCSSIALYVDYPVEFKKALEKVIS